MRLCHRCTTYALILGLYWAAWTTLAGHFRSVRVKTWGIWGVVISRARVPFGARKVTALGRTVSKRSTARRVTTSAWEVRLGARAWARPVNTLMLVNVSARATSRRKTAFL